VGDVHSEIVSLEKILDAARQFGLSDDEARRTVGGALCLYGTDGRATSPDCLDELTGALARVILAKQRRIQTDQSY
jgi:hypothetical protein